MYPPIQNLRAFVAVAETGQFRRAADKIGVSDSAVSHQIARLEAQLGVLLMERGRNGAELTPIGRAFYQQVAAGLREIDRGLELISSDKANAVTISAPQTMCSLWLAPHLASFYEAHPETELRVIATNRVCDLRAEGIDFALRRGAGPWPGCAQEGFCTEEIFPIATPDIAARITRRGWAKALTDIPLIVNDSHPREWEIWCEQAGQPLPDGIRIRRFSTFDQVQAAVINGLGLGMARAPLCIEPLADGRVVQVGTTRSQTSAYQIVWPIQHRLSPPQRALLAWLRQTRPGTS